MPEVDRISPDHDESVSSEPLGIKEPLRSPTALGQSRFLMPLGLRSLSVLQSIAVHPQVDPQVDDFDFSSVQAAEPTPFQEPEFPPNLQLFSFLEPRDEQRARFEIPARDRFERSETDHPLRIDSLQQKPSTSPKPHSGTSLPQPVQGVVQFFKSVFSRKDSPVPEQTSTPEFLSVADSPQPLSAEPPLVQPQRDTTAPAEPPQATLSSELASPFFFDRSKAAPQKLPGSNLETLQQAKDLPEGAATYAVTQQVSGSSSEILQRAKDDEINVSKDASFPFASSQAPFQKNVDSLSVDSQTLVSANDLNAIARTQFDSENAPDLEPQKVISEDSLIAALNTIQLQQKDKLDQELSPLFLPNKTLSENLRHLPETTIGEIDLEKSLTTKEVSTSKNEPREASQVQRQSVGQSTGSVQSISSVEISTGIEQVIESASSNKQISATEDYAQTNQNLSVIQTRNDELRSQDQLEIQRRNNDVLNTQYELSATNSILPLLNDVEISTLQAKQENSSEKISFSLETGAAKQPESIQSSFPVLSTQVEEPGGQISISQPTEASAENGIERAIAFVPEGFIPGIEQQEIPQPSLQFREAHPFTETGESLPKSVAPPESITPASPPQLQQAFAWTETTTASHQIISSAETLPVSQRNRSEEPAILQKKSDADTSLNPSPLHDASATSDQGALSTSLDVSPSYDHVTLTHHDASAPNPETLPVREDTSLTDHSISSTVNYGATSDPQERLADDASPNVLQLREEKAETLDLPFQESPQTLLSEDLSTSSESSLQDWDAVEVVPLASPEIQRQAENASFTDAAGATLEEVLLPEKIASLEESQLGSKNAAVQNQSDVRGDRQSFIATNQNSLEPIEPDVSIRSASPQELNIQLTENLSASEIQRQLENSASTSHVVSKDFSDIEAENHSENEILSISANDSDVFTKPLMSEPLQSEEHSEPGILSTSVNNSGVFIEPSTPDSLQLKSEQSDELAVPSNLQNISVAESFEHSSESSTALNYPGSEQHLLENTFEPSAQFTSNIPSVQAASVSTNDPEENCNLAGKSISESIEFVPDSVAPSLVVQKTFHSLKMRRG